MEQPHAAGPAAETGAGKSETTDRYRLAIRERERACRKGSGRAHHHAGGKGQGRDWRYSQRNAMTMTHEPDDRFDGPAKLAGQNRIRLVAIGFSIAFLA